MNTTEFVDLVEQCFLQAHDTVESLVEDRQSDLIKDYIRAQGFEADARKSYLTCSGICDLRLFCGKTRSKVTHWIEVKPIGFYREWQYPRPSKFFGEAPFLKDTRNLATVKDAQAWFLLAMFLYPQEVEFDPYEAPNPTKRTRLTPAQVVRIVSRWAKGKYKERRAVRIWGGFCVLYLWEVQECDATDIPLLGNEYLVG
jgi:hypothetical protein